jgi:hypothetical protein
MGTEARDGCARAPPQSAKLKTHGRGPLPSPGRDWGQGGAASHGSVLRPARDRIDGRSIGAGKENWSKDFLLGNRQRTWGNFQSGTSQACIVGYCIDLLIAPTCAHKPTFGLVPYRGHQPPPNPPPVREIDLVVVGPMARSAADLALALDVVAGPHTHRPFADRFAHWGADRRTIP